MDVCDEDLIARVVLHDDHHAFEVLVRRHQSAVRGFLRRMAGGNEVLADDVAQDAFLRAYRGLRCFGGKSNFQTWLIRIACNAYKSAMRGAKMHEDVANHEESLVQAEETRGSDLRHDIETAMNRLSERERAAITLCYMAGLTHEEAASTLEWPLGTVKSEILRGKEKLRRLLASWNEKGAAR